MRSQLANSMRFPRRLSMPTVLIVPFVVQVLAAVGLVGYLSFFRDASFLFEMIAKEQVIGYVAATTLTDIFYVSKKHTRSLEKARQVIAEILVTMEICVVNHNVIELAFSSDNSDFEDAIQIACAVSERLDTILTRDQEGFLLSPLQVLSIQQLKNLLANK